MILPAAPATLHRAKWVLADPATIVENGYVLVRYGRVVEVGQGRISADAALVDHGPGALMPGLVNAHTHLELSALEGCLPLEGDFERWVHALIDQRARLSTEDQVDGVHAAIARLKVSGCVAIGEVSTLSLSAGPLAAANLTGIWFQELLGNPPDTPPALTDVGRLRGALAGHGPHTTHPKLLLRLKQLCRQNKRPFSLHLAESAAETEFISTAEGAWARLLDERGIDYRNWPLPAASPVVYADHLGLLDANTLVVHALEVDARDRALLAARGVTVCLCPRSNHHLHRRLPDAAALVSAGVNLCLGTDSLASNTSLSLFDEMAFATAHLADLDSPTLLAMATTGGARALGLGVDYGKLRRRAPATMIYVDVAANSPEALLAQLVNLEGSTPITPVAATAPAPPEPYLK